MVELADLLVELVVHSFSAGLTVAVFDVVAVVPLIPGKVVEADKQAFDPSLGRLPTPQRVVVALLDLVPLRGQEAFKEILPADECLGLGSLLDFCFEKVIVGEEATTPPGEVLEKSLLQFRVSSGLHQISRKLGHAFRPDIIGSLGLATQDMSRVFRSIASGALVIILILPLHEGGAHATIGRGMLCHPTSAAGFQRWHAFRAGLPVNSFLGFQWEMLVPHPPHLGDRIHDETIKDGPAGGGDLGRPIPQSPPFVVYGRVGRFQAGEALEEVGPMLLCQGIHLAIERC